MNNKPKTAAYRAPGAPIGAFPVEALLDELSEKLGIDPIDFRLMNSCKEGTRRADGTLSPLVGGVEVLEAVKASPHYTSPLEGKNQGRGVALGYWRNNSGAACAIANVNPDGTIMLVEGSVDIGGSRTAVSQELAEVLRTRYEIADVQWHRKPSASRAADPAAIKELAASCDAVVIAIGD